MKKKYVAIISLSSVGLLLGGLIYLGFTSFPELLKSENELKQEENNARHIVNIIDNDIKDEETPVILSEGSSSGNYVPSVSNSSEVVLIDSSSSVVVNSSANSEKESLQKEFVSVESHIEFHEISFYEDLSHDSFVTTVSESSIEEPAILNEQVSYFSFEEHVENHSVLKATKAKKMVNNRNQSVRSNQAVVETSLLVVGAVDLISIILIRRKKHLLR